MLATQPFDVVKTRLQGLEAAEYKGAIGMCVSCGVEVSQMSRPASTPAPCCLSPPPATDCGRRIFLEEGFPALFRGVAPRLPRVVFGQSITLAGYDAIVGILNKMW